MKVRPGPEALPSADIVTLIQSCPAPPDTSVRALLIIQASASMVSSIVRRRPRP